MTRTKFLTGLFSLGVANTAFATYNKPKPKPKCECEGKPGPKGDKGDKGDPGPQGPPGICKTQPEVKMHWDAEYRIDSYGIYFPIPDIITTCRGARMDDEVWYVRSHNVMAYIDYNSFDVPKIIIFYRGGEVDRWDRIQGIGPRLLSYIGRNPANGAAHHCIVDIDRTIESARFRNRIILDWTPVTEFTTFGEFPPPMIIG